MGNEQSSTEQVIHQNSFLLQLCGKSGEINNPDEFWDEQKAKRPLSELSRLINSTRLIDHATDIPLSLFNPYLLDESMEKHSLNLIRYNTESGSLNGLLLLIVSWLNEDMNHTAATMTMTTTTTTENHTSDVLDGSGLPNNNNNNNNSGNNSNHGKEREDYLLNALVLLRVLLHRLIVHCSSSTTTTTTKEQNNDDATSTETQDFEELKKHFQSLPSCFSSIQDNDYDKNQKSRVVKIEPSLVIRPFLKSVFYYLTAMEATTSNYLIHLELLHILMVLFSTLLYHQSLQNLFLESIMHNSEEEEEEEDHQLLMSRLMRRLLDHYIVHRRLLMTNQPSSLQRSIQSSFNRSISNLFSVLGSAAGAILYLPYSAFLSWFQSYTNEEQRQHHGQDGVDGDSLIVNISSDEREKRREQEANAYRQQTNENYSEIIGRRSCMLLVLLSFYRKQLHYASSNNNNNNNRNVDGEQQEQNSLLNRVNPFLSAIESFRNSDDLTLDTKQKRKQVQMELDHQNQFHYSFDVIFQCIVYDFEERENALMCYLLLQSNKQFLNYVLSRPDTDTFMIPLLHKLHLYTLRQNSLEKSKMNSSYSSSSIHGSSSSGYMSRGVSGRITDKDRSEDSNHIFILCTILLILSQDVNFNYNNHLQMLESVPWYNESMLSNIRLGSLTCMIMFKVMLSNIRTRKDLYLNDNCLAVLNNMCANMEGMHMACAQKFFQFVSVLSKKINRIADKMNSVPNDNNEPSGEGQNMLMLLTTEIGLHVQFLQLCLEAMNTVITYNLKRNPNLIYELLQNRKTVQNLLQIPQRLHQLNIVDLELLSSVNVLANNLSIIMEFFERKLKEFEQVERAEQQQLLTEEENASESSNNKRTSRKQVRIWSVSEIMDIVDIGIKAWQQQQHYNQIHSVASPFFILEHSMYTYSEDASSEYFFLDYLWKIMIDQVDQIVWNFESTKVMSIVNNGEAEEANTTTDVSTQPLSPHCDDQPISILIE